MRSCSITANNPKKQVVKHSTSEVMNQRKAIRAEAAATTVAARKMVQACGGLEDTFRSDAQDVMASAKCFLVIVGSMIQQTSFATLSAKVFVLFPFRVDRWC
jgi:hypothetical protein